jgi:diadenosine tetraphosphate (Ap4A) HIT family hydrolase
VSSDCMACQLTAGGRDLVGGRIFQSEHWVVEHCVGTLGVGTLILKPLRHITGLDEMSAAEAANLGPLMQRATSIIKDLTSANQVYACLWSHADWTPGHIHFVLQPAWNVLRSRYPRANALQCRHVVTERAQAAARAWSTLLASCMFDR